MRGDLAGLLPEPPRVEYLSNEEHRRLKGLLTRAENSGDPLRVLAACEAALDGWRGKAWPDEWSRWARAAEDAYRKRMRDLDFEDTIDTEERERWRHVAAVLLR